MLISNQHVPAIPTYEELTALVIQRPSTNNYPLKRQKIVIYPHQFVAFHYYSGTAIGIFATGRAKFGVPSAFQLKGWVVLSK